MAPGHAAAPGTTRRQSVSLLTMVRHGQASFLASNYDQLSEIGERQSRKRGRYWSARRTFIDAVYTGPRLRQRNSAAFAGVEYEDAGNPWPSPIVLDDLDEYDLDGLMGRLAPRLAEQNPDHATLVARYERSKIEGGEPRMRAFQRMFESLMQHWQTADPSGLDLESWPAFCGRVRRVIRTIQESAGHGKHVAVFTSGGFIACSVQQALGVADTMALELNWRIRNSSLTEFVFTPDRFTLDSFNAIPHLDEPALRTYR